MYCSLHRKVQKAQKEPAKKKQSRFNDDGWVMVDAREAVSSSAVNEPLRPPRAELEATPIRKDPPGHDDGVRVEASKRTDNRHREGHYGKSYVEELGTARSGTKKLLLRPASVVRPSLGTHI